MALPPAGLDVQVFTPFVGQSFILQEGNSETLLELMSAKEQPALRSAPEFRVPFFLQFRAPPQPPQPQRVYPQRIYRLKHPVLGELDLFLVPSRKDATGVWYQATFN